MGWYDLFSVFYDRALEALYHPYRARAVEALHAASGTAVLDLACGTGQNFAEGCDAVGPGGRLVGVDLSEGMLRQARRRVARAGWANVSLVRGDAQTVSAPSLGAAAPADGFDGVLCTLGLTAMPGWEAAFTRSFDLLRPGGRYVILDVHAADRIRQTRLVELIARADLSREVWRPLERRCPDFCLDLVDAPPQTFGGCLFVAGGTKPA